MIGIVFLVAIIAAYIAYGNWLKNGIRPREFETSLSADSVRRVFEQRVAKTGWKVVDDGNPMVAQSSLATGVRQQIGLQVSSETGGRTVVRVGPQRWRVKFGVPKKGHTIRMRLNSFVEGIRTEDRSITVRLGDLR